MRFGRVKVRAPLGVRPPPPTKPAFCSKCGKPGTTMCGECIAAYRAWVNKNCGEPGGQEA